MAHTSVFFSPDWIMFHNVASILFRKLVLTGSQIRVLKKFIGFPMQKKDMKRLTETRSPKFFGPFCCLPTVK